MISVRSYVALGDSFTAGTGCEPGQCWADLVGWANRDRGGPWSPNVDCRRSAAESRHGYCYCGKIRKPEPAATGGGSDG